MFKLRKPTRRDFLQALERAGRAFGVAAFALYPANSVLSDVVGHHLDADLGTKAFVAGCTAAGAFLLRYFLPDWFRSLPPSPAADNPPNVAVAAAEAAGEPAPVDDVPPPDEAA